MHFIQAWCDIEPARQSKLRTRYQHIVGEALGILKQTFKTHREENADAVAPKKIRLDEQDILRLLCVLHFNGFSSGMYLHLCIVNHSCFPNSNKLSFRGNNTSD